MGKKRQLILAVLMSVLLCALFTGCGAGPSEPLDLEAYSDPGAEPNISADTDNGKNENAVPSGSGFVPMKAPSHFLSTDDGPLGPDFIEYETDSWVNDFKVFTWENYPGPAGTVTNFEWRVIGATKFCLMVLIDTENEYGGANRSLRVPGYDGPSVMKRGEYIHLTWISTTSPDDRISLMFIEDTNYMAITENARTGVIQEPDSEIIELAVPVRQDTDDGRYYLPLYAILNQIGGGVMFDPFGDGKAFIYTGDGVQGYTGFWEVSDDEAEYRVDVVRNGETVSVANYWWALSLNPDGTFTEYDHYFHDEGSWVKTEKDGEYAFFGRALVMKYLTETMYAGEDFDRLEILKMNEPTVDNTFSDGIALFIRYVDDWDPAEVLAINGYRVLYSHEMSGRMW